MQAIDGSSKLKIGCTSTNAQQGNVKLHTDQCKLAAKLSQSHSNSKILLLLCKTNHDPCSSCFLFKLLSQGQSVCWGDWLVPAHLHICQ